MIRAISFSLFTDDKKPVRPFEQAAYVRGLYFNVVMASMIAPTYKIYVGVDNSITYKYLSLIIYLKDKYGVQFYKNDPENNSTRCKKMLWRMKPIFSPWVWVDRIAYMFCRDTDALLSARDVWAMEDFIGTGKPVMGMHDNPAHSVPLMGGMCGFQTKALQTKYGDWGSMLARSGDKIDEHGTDQHFLTKVVYEDFKEDSINYYGERAANVVGKFQSTWKPLPNYLNGSDLCSAFIGSAGVNEMETLRYFYDHTDIQRDWDLWQQYPELFYWAH